MGINNKKIQDSIVSFVEQGKNTVEKGNLFTKWILKYMFEQLDDDIEDIIVDGKDDNSIDAFFEEGKTLYLVQCKYNLSHSWESVTKFITDLKRLINKPSNFVGQNSLLYDACEKIQQFEDNNNNINAYYITNSEFTNEDKQKIKVEVDLFNDQFEKINLYILDMEGIQDYIDMELNVVPKKYQGKVSRLVLKNNFISNITCVAEVELKHFATFVKNNKNYLFCSNIRNYLKNTSVNKGIVETFRKKSTDIWYFNNGITMVCDDFKLKNDNFLNITTPQIVNGCQTANTILKEFINMKDKDKQNNLQGTILVKIIKDKNKKKKDQITQYTNRQNSVSGKDFFALDSFQRKLAIEFEKVGYFYEIQNKSSLTKTKSELLKYKGIESYQYLFGKKFNNVLPVKKVVQAYAAGMYFMPGTASSRSGELMVYGKKWSIIFNDKTSEDPYSWLYPFAVMSYAKNNLDYNNKSKINYKRISLMFYISSYFKFFCRLLSKIQLSNNVDEILPLEVPIKYYKVIFDNEDINIKILSFVDDIVKFFMRDGLIKDIIFKKYGRDDITNFMKSEVETNERVKMRLSDIINDEISDNPNLVSEFSNLYVNSNTNN